MAEEPTFDELDEIGIMGELARRASLARWQFTRTEHELFDRLNKEEFRVFYIEEKDWKPKELAGNNTLAVRFRGWQDDMRRLLNSSVTAYGPDYLDKVSQISRAWDAATASRVLQISEEHAARLLEVSRSDRWKIGGEIVR